MLDAERVDGLELAAARQLVHAVGDPERGAERGAGVAGGGLEEAGIEAALARDAAVGDAVEDHAAGHAEVLHAGALFRERGKVQQNFLGDELQARGEVVVMLLERSRFCCTRGTEAGNELRAYARRALDEIRERAQVEAEAEVPELDELA